ncbi:BamA/TamA family outer membrane protein [Bernardetia sp. OM2101]|uniref:Omp85 family outer membrane protein n=1 Tax=Bernardetia sp. OM2101 TaxID=3344876 RepID=UPI0035CF77AE
MKQVILFLVVLFSSLFFQNSLEAQTQNNTDEIDSLSFIKSRKISDEDLAQKKEGTFITGLPDVSSDPVTGFGFGLEANIYWNGKRENPLFPYTPYLAKLAINAAYFTSNARELSVSYDVPYYKGSRWRFKVDVKAQQNPTMLYFGLTEKTLGKLSLPSNSTATFDTYKEFDEARQTIRLSDETEIKNNEIIFVTDALSNRFKETEYMLNLKADYVIGNGKWRAMGGYEIQHLSYATFEGLETEGKVPVTGDILVVPNGSSLLRRDFNENKISGIKGGWVSIIQTALIYDTRDFEPDPTKGFYFEIANEYSSKLIGSQFDFDKFFIQGRVFQKLPIGKRTVLAGRVGIGNIFGNNAPFFEYQDQWSPDGSINALGGGSSLRGYRQNRFLARSMWFTNVELRVRLLETKIAKQLFGFSLAPFVDAGTVRDKWQDLNFKNVKTSYGAGLRIAWNQSTILSLDYGRSKEDALLYFGIGQIF